MRTRASLCTCAVLALLSAFPSHAQNQPSEAERILVTRAHAQEARGRNDLAAETWKQVLLTDSNNTEALAGAARADMALGNNTEARSYIERLKQINPNDPQIAAIENISKQQAASPKLAEAGRLAESGQYAQAMAIYRQQFGNNPPPGDIALGYYETEAATEDGRPAAIAGLRDMAHRYPNDSRYEVALGKILTYNAKTRAEGIALLQKHPGDSVASEALRQALTWDSASPGSLPAIRAYLKNHPDADLEARAKETESKQAKVTNNLARNAEERSAYAALAANKTTQAEQRFQAILAREPNNYRALAGLGFVRLKQSNFADAKNYFERSEQNGGKDPAIRNGYDTASFWLVMSEAAAAKSANQLEASQRDYEHALQMRPSSPEALDGLAGLYLKMQQPAQAAGIYSRLVHVQSNSVPGWRGLFVSQAQSGDPNAALETVQHFPPPVRAQLANDPEYLATLASVYQATGRISDAQRVLDAALKLPFPNGGQGMQADTQMQYASLLMQANRPQQAAGLYRQILVANPTNLDAYEGLVRALHAAGDDAGALDIAQRMPQDLLAKAETDPGFLATLASIYQSQNHLDVARQLLEQAMAQSQAAGRSPAPNLKLQLAGVYMAQGDSANAYAIYQQVLSANPNMVDAWKGLLSALHTTDRDREALAELQQIPPATLAQLNRDPQFLAVLASVYSGAGMNQQAMSTLHQVSLHYQQQGTPVPADVNIQFAYLLMNADDNQDLYTLLMSLGGRQDLTVPQRVEVQKIWALWSVRRANAEVKRGNYRRAIEILNAANRAFPNNPDVQKALAGGYQTAGDAKKAEAVYLQMDWSNPSLADYRGAISAALAANDKKQALVWLQPALQKYPNDPSVLQLAAQYEQARGDNPKAAQYYKAALDAMGPQDPSADLVSDLDPSRGGANNAANVTNGDPTARLAALLAPVNASAASVTLPPLATTQQPFISALPGADYMPGQAPIQIGPTANSTPPAYHSMPLTSTPGVQQRHRTITARKQRQDAQPVPATTQPVQQQAAPAQPAPAQPMQQPAQRLGDYVPSSALREQRMPNDGSWTVRYASWTAPLDALEPQQAGGDSEVQVAPNAKLTYQEPFFVERDKNGKVIRKSAPVQPTQTQAAAAPRSSGMHLHMPGPAPVTNTAQAPVETVPGISYAPVAKNERTRDAQYAGTQQQSGQPASQQQMQLQQQYSQQSQSAGGNTYAAPPAPLASQNYPSTVTNGAVSQPAGSPYNPNYGSGYTGYNDYRLPVQQQPEYSRVLPPLTGGYSYQDSQLPRQPLTERQKIENQLNLIEGGYSPWLGASPYFSYRSGQQGLDRLLIFSAPIEGSFVFNNALRMTLVAKPVLLDSGTQTSTTPYRLGSQPGGCGTTGTPCQFYTQTASGIGGEIQLRTQNYGGSVGSTPGGFLVQNVIGSFFARPAAGPFTFTFVRDSIIDTQLSYSGLHDPYQTTNPVWGGVIANAFEGQFATGNERSGFYAQGGGQYISGKLVPDNWRIDGDAGAYWRVKDWPEYGGLTIGANVFAMHYNRNLRYFTFGQGGYFSPDAYGLANIPVTFYGHSGRNFHYRINGSIGVQAFNEDASPFFPLTQLTSTCTGTTVVNCYPAATTVSGNYLIDAEASYRITDHWYFGGFFNANNSRDYNNASAGFFVRYMFRQQYGSEEGPPTGIFPVNGLRPVLVP